ncbi:MAG: carboxylesterase family protein [Planctomycetota bacterium]|jgi:poly(3-hydroxybutyrate) depolymerase
MTNAIERNRKLGACLAAVISVSLFSVVNASAADPVANTVRVMSGRFEQNEMLLERLYGGFIKVKTLGGIPKGDADELEALEKEFYAAYDSGDKGQARRLLHCAFALVTGVKWTEREEFRRSLIVRTNMTVFDPDFPFIARLEQLYPSQFKPSTPLKLRVLLFSPTSRQARKPVKELGKFEYIPHDLIDRPYAFAVELNDVRDGSWALGIEIVEGEQRLRRIRLPVRLVSDLAKTRKEIEQRLDAVAGYDNVKASIRYPFELTREINLGRREPRKYNFVAGIENSLKLLSAIEQGRDPLTGGVGDQKRHYLLDEANEILPYRIYVPKKYDGKTAFPLIVALHGGGGDENTMLGRPKMRQLAEEHGYIVVAPSGYAPYGGYGKPFEEDRNPSLARMTRLSEMDVMKTLELMRAEYNIDNDRVYLMGHSMGGNGTWRLGAKYAENWTALAPIASGQATPEGFVHAKVARGNAVLGLRKPYDFDAIKHIPVLVSHGVLDPRAPVENARAMVAKMKELGMTYEYFEKADGTHAMVAPSLAKVFVFFNKHTGRDPDARWDRTFIGWSALLRLQSRLAWGNSLLVISM